MHITVTKPYLPKKEKYISYINDIWERNWLTNGGPLTNKLESLLKDYLGINDIVYLSNGTIALQIALKSLELKGEVITTPFSYVATTSSIVWENLKPVFIDIDPETYNIDTRLIEDKITKKTTAILATHVFGNPCEIDAINEIAAKHNLKVIYDASHCFGVSYKNRSIFEYGDLSTTSFHATKLYHTIEGGAIISVNKELIRKIEFMRNFGHHGPENFEELGINAKNSEFHAAMGILILEDVEVILKKRRDQYQRYQNLFKNKDVQIQKITKNTNYNYSYFSILLKNEGQLKKVQDILNAHGIFPRRYFHPSLNTLHYVDNHSCPVAESISSKILCLPMYHDLKVEEQEMIFNLISTAI